MTRRRRKHRPEEIVAKLRDADAMLNAGSYLAAGLEAGELTLDCWPAPHGGIKCEEAKMLKRLANSRVLRPRSPAASTSPRNSFEYGFMVTSLEMPTLPGFPSGR
jgi:hypothetical protein